MEEKHKEYDFIFIYNYDYYLSLHFLLFFNSHYFSYRITIVRNYQWILITVYKNSCKIKIRVSNLTIDLGSLSNCVSCFVIDPWHTWSFINAILSQRSFCVYEFAHKLKTNFNTTFAESYQRVSACQGV